MKLQLRLADALGVIICASVLVVSQAHAGTIVAGTIIGLDSSGGVNSVDPITGQVTTLGAGERVDAWITSSAPNGYYWFAPRNLYYVFFEVDVSSGYLTAFTYRGERYARGDFAYDSDKGIVYSAGFDSVLRVPTLYQFAANPRRYETGYPWPPKYEVPEYYVRVGPLQVSGIQVIEYIPGLGLYGPDGYSAGYLIDEATGQATLLAPLNWPSGVPFGVVAPITGLAYDRDSARLIASSGSNPYGFSHQNQSGVGKIYLVDPVTGVVTVLNDNAPNIYGISAVLSIPEPGPVWLVVAGLAICAARGRRSGSRRRIRLSRAGRSSLETNRFHFLN